MATIYEIAQKAGVSPALVSLALNGKPRVSPQTAEKILKIAGQMGYRRSPQKKLRSAALRFIRLTKADDFLGESHSTFFAEYFEGAEQYLADQGSRTEVASYTGDRLGEVVKDLRGRQVRGAVVLGTELSPGDMAVFSESPVPLVFLDTCHDFLPFDYCTMNNLDAVNLVLRHLHDMGYHSIGMVGSLVESGNFSERKAAFHACLAALDIRDNRFGQYFAVPETGPATGQLTALFRRRRPPPALFCFTDNLAYAAIEALSVVGLTVPDDVSVVGFDDLSASAIMRPALTTVAVPTRAMGAAAARLLCDRIENPGRPPEKTRLGCELVVRDSVFDRRR